MLGPFCFTRVRVCVCVCVCVLHTELLPSWFCLW